MPMFLPLGGRPIISNGYGLRYEIQEFISCIINGRYSSARLRRKESICMAQVMERFAERKNFVTI